MKYRCRVMAKQRFIQRGRRQAPRITWIRGKTWNHRQLTGRIFSLKQESRSPQVGVVVVPRSLPVWRVVPVPRAWLPWWGFPLGRVRLPNRVPVQAAVCLQCSRAGEAGIALRHRTDVRPEVDVGLQVLQKEKEMKQCFNKIGSLNLKKLLS